MHLYDLQRQILLKKLSTGTRALSCMAIHSGGIFVRRIINTGCQFSPMPFLGVHRGEYYRWWRRWKSFMVKTQILICQKGSNWYSFFALYFRFDLDLSTMPYKVLGSHASAVKVIYWHPFDKYIAMAWDWTNSLHRTLTFIQHILCLPRLLMMRLSTYFMGMVHADLDRNALITPLRILRSHCSQDCEGVKGCAFHPTQPWLFSAGADGSIILFCDDV